MSKSGTRPPKKVVYAREAKNEAEFTSSKLGSGGGGEAGFIPAQTIPIEGIGDTQNSKIFKLFFGLWDFERGDKTRGLSTKRKSPIAKKS